MTLADAVVRARNLGENWGPETAFQLDGVSFENASKVPHTHRLKNVGKDTVPHNELRILALIL